uniref:hypothetical protein n=1 Tax=Priestia megaterium TaxID=1404 RepID=UPI00164994B9
EVVDDIKGGVKEGVEVKGGGEERLKRVKEGDEGFLVVEEKGEEKEGLFEEYEKFERALKGNGWV